MIILEISFLRARPLDWIAGRFAVSQADFREPLIEISVVKRPGIERAERVTANTLRVFEHERQLRFEPQIRSDVDVTERLGIVEGERRVLSVVSGPQTNVIGGVHVPRLTTTDIKRGDNHWIGLSLACVGTGLVRSSARGVAVEPRTRRDKYQAGSQSKQMSVW